MRIIFEAVVFCCDRFSVALIIIFCIIAVARFTLARSFPNAPTVQTDNIPSEALQLFYDRLYNPPSLLEWLQFIVPAQYLLLPISKKKPVKQLTKNKVGKSPPIGITYRMKLKANKRPVILEYVTAVAITGTIFSILSGSFLSSKIDFTPKGIDAKLMSE